MVKSRDKIQYETLTQYKKYRTWKYSLKAATYASTLVPFAAELGVNWNDWFGPRSSSAPSIGMGFAMLIVSTVCSIVAVMKKDEDFMKKFSPLFYVAVIAIMWAGTFMFLSAIMQEMGKMLLYAALGILAGAISDETEKQAIEPKYVLYRQLADDAGLTKKGEFVKHAKETAEKDKVEKENAKEHHATD